MTANTPNLELLKNRHRPPRTAALPADLPLPVMAEEGEPALRVARPHRVARPFRLETKITAEAGQRLLAIIAELSQRRGKRQTANLIIEQALVLFEKQLGS